MKKVALFLGLLMSVSLFADTTQTERVYFDGTQQVDSVETRTEVTRTEYRTVTVPSTCYRTEYRYRCTMRPSRCRTRCDRNRNCRRICSRPRRICRNVPVRVPYRCMRQVQQPYEVLDYYVDTEINFEYDLSDILNGAGEEFEVTVSGKEVNMSVADSGNYLILKKNEIADAQRSADTLTQKITYDLDFVQMSKVRGTLGAGVQDVSYRNGVLYFALGKGFNTKDFIQNIKIYNSRRFRTDVLLFDRNLTENQMDIQTNGNQTQVSIDMTKLNVNLPSRMRVIMTSKYNTRGAEPLNIKESELEASANWIFSK